MGSNAVVAQEVIEQVSSTLCSILCNNMSQQFVSCNANGDEWKPSADVWNTGALKSVRAHVYLH